MIDTAVIMAAGMGTRFGDKTKVMPKGFIPYKSKPMIERSVETLLQCGIKRIVIGTGYHREYYDELAKRYAQIECVFSPKYASTNSMYTLWNCRESIGAADFLLLESDLIFEKKAITSLIDCSYSTAMLITPVTKFQDQYYVLMNNDNELTDCSTSSDKFVPSGELVGIHKIGHDFFAVMCNEYQKSIEYQQKLGYEYMLLQMSQTKMPMNVLKIDGLQWYEIDDDNDLNYAEKHINID